MLKRVYKSISNSTHFHPRHLQFEVPGMEMLKRNYAAETRSEWRSTIGLEVHAQISSSSKLFSSGSSAYGYPTNSCVNLFDAAIPGTLPVINKKAVELAVLASLALKCDVNPVSLFDRKHYFYADLPNGYQITQQRKPLAVNGTLDFAVFNCAVHKKPYYKTTKIKQIQLEQDSGKSYHDMETKETFIDLNRAGIALIEIVFEPDLVSGEEAAAVVKELCFILKSAGCCSCKMEEGALRVDVNVSIHKEGGEMGVRTEIKNIGSIRGVAQAVEYEISRQVKIVKEGGTILNQTLAWNSLENKTVIIRDKEDHHDYRFMPEPNLPPLRVVTNRENKAAHQVDRQRGRVMDLSHLSLQVPLLPQEKRNLLMHQYKASDLIAYNLVNIPRLYEYFMEIMMENPDRSVKAVYLLLINTLLTVLNKMEMDLSECTIPFYILGEIADLRVKSITEKGGQFILEEILKGSTLTPRQLMEEHDLELLTEEQVRNVCLEEIENNPKAFADFMKGKKNVHKFFIRRAVGRTNSKASTVVIEKMVLDLLEKKKNNGL